MITIEKLKLYKKYNGSVDAFTCASKRDKKKITESEFRIIESLLQDFKLIQKGFTGDNYKEEANKRIKESCDNINTINYLMSMG